MLSIIYPLTQLSGVARCGAICWSCSTLQYCSDVHPTACSYFPVHKSSLVKEFTQARLAIEWEVIFVSSYSRCLMFQYINLHDVIACGYICTEKVVMAHRSEELETTIISYTEACRSGPLGSHHASQSPATEVHAWVTSTTILIKLFPVATVWPRNARGVLGQLLRSEGT